MGASPLGGLSRSYGGSFPLQSARLRLLRATAAAFRSSRRCFGFFGLRRQLYAPVGAASAASDSGGSFPLQSERLRLLRASLGAGRCSSSGFVCSPLLGLLVFGRRWAASLCFASLRHPSPRHLSRSVCLRPPRFRSAAPLRPPLPPPLPPSATSSRLRPPPPPQLPPSATSSRLRCCPLPPKLLPLCIVSRETFILNCST